MSDQLDHLPPGRWEVMPSPDEGYWVTGPHPGGAKHQTCWAIVPLTLELPDFLRLRIATEIADALNAQYNR